MSNNLANLISRINAIKFKKDIDISSSLHTGSIQQTNTQHLMVLFHFIGLSARLAEIDGPTNDNEITRLISIFPNFLNAAVKVKNLYYLAVADKTPALSFATKIKLLYPSNYLLMQQIIENLIKIADADKPINTLEYMFINNILNEFNFAAGTIDKLIEAYFFQDSPTTPFKVLGIKENSSLQDINNAYKAKIMKLHPDRIYAYNNVAPIYKINFEKKYQEVSNAYKALLKLREPTKIS